MSAAALNCSDAAVARSALGRKLILHVFASLAQFERGIIRERTMAGLAATRSDGRYAGRPQSLSEDNIEIARVMLAKGETMKS